MSVEYVRFRGGESIYGEKNLLGVELGTLSFVKRLRNYKKLRQDELVFKILLKKKFDEVIEQLNVLDKLLPHSKMAGLIKKPKPRSEFEGMNAEDKAALTLEQEIEAIRRKLERLKVFS